MALDVQHLTFSRNNQTVLHDVSLSVRGGSIVAFLGPNGSGKTTTLQILIGLIPHAVPKDHESHYLLFANKCFCLTSIHQRIAAGLIYMPQQSSLFESLTARENIEIIFEYHEAWRQKSKQDFFNFIDPWIEKTGIRSALQTQARHLSGGQKRKVELIRTLTMYPKILLLDEPFAGVDPKSIEEIQVLLYEVAKQGVGILISDHHVFQLLTFVHYCYLLVGGQIIAQGTSDQIVNDQVTQEAYLGKRIGFKH